MARDALAKALYCRTVATIVRRANSLKRLCMSGTLSSDSNDSVHNQAEVPFPASIFVSNSTFLALNVSDWAHFSRSSSIN